ncbi:MAG: DUF1016 domain-containing protein [Firmicutes bacterium]|nr:DUF1016 domain-containing protein [Bacillota bacterium]
MNYYNEIKKKIIDDEVYSKIKNYSKERHRVITYFEIGKLLKDAGGKYGDNIIDEYSKKLVVEVGKKYNRRTLFRMKQFYNVFSNEKVSTLWTQLTWSHIRLLFGLDYNAINYYIQVTINKQISVRKLEDKLKYKEYERLPNDTKNKLINNNKSSIVDYVKNPIIIKNNHNYEIVSEKLLQKLILEDIPTFLEELGDGFTFIRNEYKIKIGDSYNYIDLLLYNIEYNCYVVVELKLTELKKEHIGQIQVYMNYIDENLKKITQNKTIGIIICKQDNKYIIKYCSEERIIAREYELL